MLAEETSASAVHTPELGTPAPGGRAITVQPRHRRAHDEQRRERPAQPGPRDAAGVEDGDQDDGADVIDDGQGEQEQLESLGDALAEEREHADGERDVGGDRDSPPGRSRARKG